MAQHALLPPLAERRKRGLGKRVADLEDTVANLLVAWDLIYKELQKKGMTPLLGLDLPRQIAAARKGETK